MASVTAKSIGYGMYVRCSEHNFSGCIDNLPHWPYKTLSHHQNGGGAVVVVVFIGVIKLL